MLKSIIGKILSIIGRGLGVHPGVQWLLVNLRPLHRNVIFIIENHFSLAKWLPLLSVASPASGLLRTQICIIVMAANEKFATGAI